MMWKRDRKANWYIEVKFYIYKYSVNFKEHWYDNAAQSTRMHAYGCEVCTISSVTIKNGSFWKLVIHKNVKNREDHQWWSLPRYESCPDPPGGYCHTTVKFSLKCVTERGIGKVSSDRLCWWKTSQRQTRENLSHLHRQNVTESVNGTFTNCKTISLFGPGCVYYSNIH